VILSVTFIMDYFCYRWTPSSADKWPSESSSFATATARSGIKLPVS